MQALHTFVQNKIFRSAILPLVFIELLLILLIFIFGFVQEEKNEELMQETAAQSFEEVAHQVSERMNAKIEQVQKDANALKHMVQEFFVQHRYYQDPALSFKYHEGFFIREHEKHATVYTTDREVLRAQDRQNLKILSMAETPLHAVMQQYKGMLDSAWINLGKHTSLYYPRIVVEDELSPDLDPTQQSYYYQADAQHNPQKMTRFVPLFHEPWALAHGQIGSVVAPIYVADEMKGVLGMTLTVVNTQEISDISLPFDAYIIFVGKEGHVLFASDEEAFRNDFGIESFAYLHKQGRSAALTPFHYDPDTKSNFVLFQKMLQQTGLNLILVAKKDNINKEINKVYRQTRQYGVISLLVIGLIHLLLFLYLKRRTRYLSKFISGPVVQVAEVSQKLFDEQKLELQESDISEFGILYQNLHKAHDTLLERLYFDTQTGLPNVNKLQRDIKEGSTLILISVDNYKLIQNIYGPKVSSEVLIEVRNMLEAFPRSAMRLYRIYNDTFALLSDAKVHLQDELAYLYNRLSLADIRLESFEIALNYSLSLALPCAESELTLFARADIALDEAKKQEHRKYVSFDDEQTKKEMFSKNQARAKRFQEALNEHRLVPFFQPIYDIKAKHVRKFESLVRMIEGEEVITPNFFLDVAKKMGKLTDITLLMLRGVFEQAQRYPEVEFSINTSFEDFEEANLMNDIRALLDSYHINAQKIIIEILETGQYKDEYHAISTIEQLKKIGFKIAIDDFGAGNSNFAHLMLMQVDYIKIDGQFVKNLVSDEKGRNITKTIHAVAHMAGALSVAEFVTDEAVFKEVSKMGIDYAQGYYICEPRPASQIDNMLSIKDLGGSLTG